MPTCQPVGLPVKNYGKHISDRWLINIQRQLSKGQGEAREALTLVAKCKWCQNPVIRRNYILNAMF